LLDWKPDIALKEGLIKTIAYFERLLSEQQLRAQLLRRHDTASYQPPNKDQHLLGEARLVQAGIRDWIEV
jgi:hypothetical protein